jgi:hypothetical protein
LFHFGPARWSPSSMPARACARRHAPAPAACRLLMHRETIHVCRVGFP